MSKSEMHIGIGSMDQFGRDFIDSWKKGERGLGDALPEERVCFLELSTMLTVLSEKRLELLRVVQHSPEISTYQLAKELKRDSKNVYSDVHLLKSVGLIEADEGKPGLRVPFTKIHAEINLAA